MYDCSVFFSSFTGCVFSKVEKHSMYSILMYKHQVYFSQQHGTTLFGFCEFLKSKKAKEK